MPHSTRPRVSPHKPHHVTVRVTRGTWNLRSQRCFRPVRAELARVARRANFRVVHFSVQHNHMHLIVEANDRRAMGNGLRALLSRIALGLNAVMGARGPRFVDRYHQHILGTPSEVRNAMYYVLGNRARHVARWGRVDENPDDDPFSSVLVRVVTAARSWLLREGWTRAGP